MRIEEDAPGKRALLMGNHAVARGAIEAGVQLVVGYPGTPSSEVIEALSQADIDAHVQWSTNEKVAFDVAVGGAIVGARSMATMKNAGLNWIMDMLMTVVYGGVRGGLVVYVADDPGAHYSSNEQDTRMVALYAKIPCLEPSNQQEAKDLTKMAFDLSEELELPVMVRSVTRISHSSGDVVFGEIRKERNKLAFDRHWKMPYRWNVYGPPGPVAKHKWLYEQLPKAKEAISKIGEPYNFLKLSDSEFGVIACGIAYGYVMEAIERLGVEVNLLKLSTPFPLPEEKIKKLIESCKKILVVEENEPVVELQLRDLAQRMHADVEIYGRYENALIEPYDELSHNRVTAAIAKLTGVGFEPMKPAGESLKPLIAPRSSMLCAGCPHLGMYWALKLALARKGGKVPIVNGDIGCYEQGGYGIVAKKVEPSFSTESRRYVIEAPYEMLDTNYIMGGGFGLAMGEFHAGYPDGKIVGLAGDSTFFHADLPALANAVVNKSKVLFLVLDNRWTAMTGHQPSPTTGVTARGQPTSQLDIEQIARAMGVKFIRRADPWNLKEMQRVIEEALEYLESPEADGPALVISDRVCTLQALRRKEYRPTGTYTVIEDKCTGCKLCVQLGCPANAFDVDKKKAFIDQVLCVNCGMCAEVCPAGAIVPREST